PGSFRSLHSFPTRRSSDLVYSQINCIYFSIRLMNFPTCPHQNLLEIDTKVSLIYHPYDLKQFFLLMTFPYVLHAPALIYKLFYLAYLCAVHLLYTLQNKPLLDTFQQSTKQSNTINRLEPLLYQENI